MPRYVMTRAPTWQAVVLVRVVYTAAILCPQYTLQPTNRDQDSMHEYHPIHAGLPAWVIFEKNWCDQRIKPAIIIICIIIMLSAGKQFLPAGLVFITRIKTVVIQILCVEST